MIFRLIFFILFFLPVCVSAGVIPSVFTHSKNEYKYNNGLGRDISGSSILVSGINLEWLPLNFTTNYSYKEISKLTTDGQQFHGWRLATDTELSAMLKAYLHEVTINLSDSSNKPEINGAFDTFYPFFGDTYSPLVGDVPSWWKYGYGYAIGFYDEITNDPYPQYVSALIFSDARYNLPSTYLNGDILFKFHGYGINEKYDSIGSYLVRNHEVASPAILINFLFGLFALAVLRKKTNS